MLWMWQPVLLVSIFVPFFFLKREFACDTLNNALIMHACMIVSRDLSLP